MPRIETIPYDQAEGELKSIYDEIVSKRGKLPGVLEIQSLHPASIRSHTALFVDIMFSKTALTRGIQILIAYCCYENARLKEFCLSGSSRNNDFLFKSKFDIMANRLMQAVVAGIVATAVMTIFEAMAPYMGLPKMNPAEMLSGMLSVSLALGWAVHFMVGLIFAFAYVYLFNPAVKINSKFGKGLLFGLAVFVFAQVMMWIMGKLMPMPAMAGNKMLMMMLGSLAGHFVYGLFVAWIVPLPHPASPKSNRVATAA